MEPDSLTPPEDPTGTGSTGDDHSPTLDIGKLVPDDVSSTDLGTHDDPLFCGTPTTTALASPTEQEPTMESLHMAHQCQQLEEEGLGPQALDTALSPAAQLSRDSAYAPIQHQFAVWCSQHSLSPTAATAASIVNFLAEHQETGKWSSGTVLAYHSALLDLQAPAHCPDIQSSLAWKAYFCGVTATEVVTLEKVHINLAPILHHLCSKSLATVTCTELTQWVCWLLSIVGLLRPSNLECIDAAHITTDSSGQLQLILIAPKEKRSSAHVE
ncbi:hypothetical protein GGH92_000229 [Coemansia sp. RSA 2673]|nr:hypothetical protein GGH92_000229 [Coemansia sp. RSA 2673]